MLSVRTFGAIATVLSALCGQAIAGPDQPWLDSPGSGSIGRGIALVVLAAIGYAVWSDYKRQVFALFVGLVSAWIASLILTAIFGTTLGGILALALGAYVMVWLHEATGPNRQRKDG